MRKPFPPGYLSYGHLTLNAGRVYQRTCRECRAHFETKLPAQRECSKACAHAHNLKWKRKLRARIRAGMASATGKRERRK